MLEIATHKSVSQMYEILKRKKIIMEINKVLKHLREVREFEVMTVIL